MKNQIPVHGNGLKRKLLSSVLALAMLMAVLSAAFASLTAFAADPTPVGAKAYTVAGNDTDIYVLFEQSISADTVSGTFPWIADGAGITANADQVTYINEHLVKYSSGAVSAGSLAKGGATILYIPTWGAPAIADAEYTPLSSVNMWGSPRPDCFVMDVYLVTSENDIGDPAAEKPVVPATPLVAKAYTVDGDANSVYLKLDRKVTSAEMAGSFVWIDNGDGFTANADTITYISDTLVKYTSAYNVADILRAGARVFYIIGWGAPSIAFTTLTPTTTISLWSEARICFEFPYINVGSTEEMTKAAVDAGNDVPLLAQCFTVTGEADNVYVLFNKDITADEVIGSFAWIAEETLTVGSGLSLIDNRIVKYSSAGIAAKLAGGKTLVFLAGWGSPAITDRTYQSTPVMMWGEAHSEAYIVTYVGAVGALSDVKYRNLTLTVNGNVVGTTYAYGEWVPVSADTSEGKVFTGWESEDITIFYPYEKNITIPMPAGDVALTAGYYTYDPQTAPLFTEPAFHENKELAGIDGGYYAEEKDGEKTGAMLAFTAQFNALADLRDKLTVYGMYVHRSGNEANKVSVSADTAGIEELSDSFYALIDVPADKLDTEITVIPYVVIAGNIYCGDAMTACANDFSGNWLGSAN